MRLLRIAVDFGRPAFRFGFVVCFMLRLGFMGFGVEGHSPRKVSGGGSCVAIFSIPNYSLRQRRFRPLCRLRTGTRSMANASALALLRCI